MKLEVWRRLAATRLVPELRGWTADGWVLHGVPREWFATALVVAAAPGGSAFSVNAVVQFLPVPKQAWSADSSLETVQGRTTFPSPGPDDDAAPVMAEVLVYVREQAIPFLDARAGVDGRLAYLQERVDSVNAARGGDHAWQDVNLAEELCYAHLLAGDRPTAVQYAGWAARSAEIDPRPWARAARDRVARVIAAPDGGLSLLHSHADATRAALRVPRWPA